MTVQVKVGSTDITNKVIDSSVSITYGRQYVNSPICDATTCTFELLRSSSLGTIADDFLTIGKKVTVTKNTGLRFSGQISDVTMGNDTITVVSTSGLLDRAGRAQVTITVDQAGTWNSGGAVSIIAGLIDDTVYGPVPDWEISYGTTSVVLSETTDAGVLDLIETITNGEPAGVLFETLVPLGICWTDANDRRDMTPDLQVSPNDIGYDYVMSKRIGTKVNAASVTWTGGVAEVVVEADRATYGQYPAEVTTLLADGTQAEYVAARLVGNYITPEWQFESLFLPVSELTSTQRANVLGLRVGSVLRIFGGFSSRWYVEGWTEVLGTSRWEMTLYVSDVTLSRAPQRWSDVGPAVTWAGVTVTGETWLDCLRKYLGEILV